ncbi:MAG: transposase [Desulfobacterales bacterium]|nr:transposase [Desulfobacterales bacterium]MCF8077746.1 transposase [Desulfobacterales bacterium]
MNRPLHSIRVLGFCRFFIMKKENDGSFCGACQIFQKMPNQSIRRSYKAIGKLYAAHDWFNYSEKEFVRGNAHNNTAELKLTKKGKLKIVMKPMPVLIRLRSLLSDASGRLLRRTVNGGIVCLTH